ncbi:transposase [Micromonospora sp. CPCC 205371]|nr:transposase [Micromonospora sp. CPCC 205371]
MSGEEDDAVALVRVYCGLASADPAARPAPAESPLTVAVVDDAGRLLDVCEISDDPAGYARLAALLVERSSGPTGVAIAADSDDHLVTSLLTAAGRPLAIADDDAADDYAERFADDESVEEMQSPAAERRAVGLARALQAGALSAVVLPVPRDLLPYKPVLAAHAALCNGRLSAAVALREVLRELYPAALRAYPDPAEPVSLAVLDALPEPGMLNGGRRESAAASEALITRLAADGLAEADTIDDAITALRVAISETPRRSPANKSLTSAVAETVRQAVAAVRACDAGCDALVGTLSARLTSQPTNARRSTVRRAATPATPPAAGLHAVRTPTAEHAATRVGRRARPEPAAASSTPASPQPLTTPPVAPAPVHRPPVAPPPVNRPAATTPPQPPAAPTPPPTRPVPAAPAAASVDLPAASRPAPPPPAPLPLTPPMSPAALSAPTPLPIRSSAPPARPSPSRSLEAPAARAEVAGPRPPEMAPDPARQAEAPNRPISAPPPPPPGITPIAPVVPGQRTTAPVDAGEPFRATLTTAAINSARAERRPTPIVPRPNTRTDPPPAPAGGGFAATDLTVPVPTPRPAPDAPPGSRANWPLVGSDDDRATVSGGRQPGVNDRPYGYSELDRQTVPAASESGRVKPPWQADDLPQEPPSLRLVEPPPLADRALRDDLTPAALGPSALDTPSLRLVDTDNGARSPRSRRAVERSAVPVAEEGDGDLLIFAQTRSAWFIGHPEQDSELTWTSSSVDSGWRAAEQAARPAVGAETTSGLPRRVPNANLVPGSPLREERPLRTAPAAETIAAHTSSYFRGWRRGQEIGGSAVGGRPGREAGGGWDFSRDTVNQDDTDGYGYRSPAAYRS